MKKLKFLIMLLAVVPMLMTGCKKNKSGQTSTVKFNITDAPADFDALNIDVQGVQVHTQADGWVTLSSSLGTINILNYVNGSSTLVAQGDISAGTIDQVRLMLGSDNSVVVNGNSFSLGASGTGQA
ncbi:MAG TPA: DUF4382 domain-containing protein, partial [Chitinophagales bacterium]|nr:DUF4382 domain-containing protein [Chitinophagales bacterium]